MDFYLPIPAMSSLPSSSSRFIHINCLSFSTDDLYLTTSSSTETVHIFKLVEPTQEKYVQYIPHCVQFMYSSKSHTGLLLCTAFQYFLLPTHTKCYWEFVIHSHRAPEEQQGWMSYIGKAIGSTASYLVSWLIVADSWMVIHPLQGSDALSMNRAFAQLKLPKPGM